ncbi:hypothetical protein D3C75_908930 [compost metagenome]
MAGKLGILPHVQNQSLGADAPDTYRLVAVRIRNGCDDTGLTDILCCRVDHDLLSLHANRLTQHFAYKRSGDIQLVLLRLRSCSELSVHLIDYIAVLAAFYSCEDAAFIQVYSLRLYIPGNLEAKRSGNGA